MADINQDNVRVQVLIKEQTPYGEFNDALYFTSGEFETLDQKTLEQKKQERIDNWITAVTTPTIQLEPTDEQLQVQKLELEAITAQLAVELSALDQKIATKKIIISK